MENPTIPTPASIIADITRALEGLEAVTRAMAVPPVSVGLAGLAEAEAASRRFAEQIAAMVAGAQAMPSFDTGLLAADRGLQAALDRTAMLRRRGRWR